MAALLTVQQFLTWQAANPGARSSLVVEDSAANIAHSFGALFSSPSVRSIVVGDSGTLSLPAADFFEALSPGLYGKALTISKLGGGPVHLQALSSVSVSQLLNDEARHITPPSTVADSSANVAAGLDKVNADSHVTSIYLQDAGPLSLTGHQAQNDLKALGQIVTPTTLNVTVSRSEGAVTLTSTGQNTNYTLQNSGDSFVLHSGFGQDTVTGAQPGHVSLSIDHALAANFTALTALAHDDGHGDVVIAFNAHDSLTLNGVTLAQLKAHASDWHFI